MNENRFSERREMYAVDYRKRNRNGKTRIQVLSMLWGESRAEGKNLPCLRKVDGKKLKDDRNGRTAGGGQ